MKSGSEAKQAILTRLKRREINRRIHHMLDQVNAQFQPGSTEKPVLFFNASTRLVGLSLNAGFSLLTSMALRLQNIPVLHYVCQAGMSRCVLGTDRSDYQKTPPCRSCIQQSTWFYSHTPTVPFYYHEDAQLSEILHNLSLDQLMAFPFTAAGEVQGPSPAALPLGAFVLPSIRWVLRRHHLPDDENTRFLYRQYILSAHSLAQEFSALLDKAQPQAVILFNGQFFPEATARWLSLQRGIRTITHEVGLQPFTAFFTTGQATAYPLHVPDDFELTQQQDERLDAYLGKRFKGQFSMAGVRFWPEIHGLDKDFLDKAKEFKQIVPVFTNVVFDTSQPHSNLIFPHMFAWLDLVLGIIRKHPETLFIIRAHPDESRPGKASQESVSQWIAQNQASSLPNLIFVDSRQPLSSYELIQRSKFVMVYNSTIGLEAAILGYPVLCAGRARFTQLPTVFFPNSAEQYAAQAEAFLEAAYVTMPPEFQRNARRFLYYQLYRSSLPFDEYLEEDGIWPGFVRLKDFSLQSLLPSASRAIKAILKGILENGDFLLESDPNP
jgi:hypothetical protein